MFIFSVMSDSFRPHGMQHASLPCPSQSPGVCSNSCPLDGIIDAIQPSHLLSAPSPPSFSLSPNQGLFQWVSSSCQVAKLLELQLQYPSFQWIFRIDFLYNWLVWSPCCPRDSQEFSSSTVQKYWFFSAQPSLWSNSHILIWLLEKLQLWLYRP